VDGRLRAELQDRGPGLGDRSGGLFCDQRCIAAQRAVHRSRVEGVCDMAWCRVAVPTLSAKCEVVQATLELAGVGAVTSTQQCQHQHQHGPWPMGTEWEDRVQCWPGRHGGLNPGCLQETWIFWRTLQPAGRSVTCESAMHCAPLTKMDNARKYYCTKVGNKMEPHGFL